MSSGTVRPFLPGASRERFDTRFTVPPWVRLEHEARYAFAETYVRGRRVIDCACGSGISSRRFVASGAERVEAFDLSREAIDAAREGGAGDRLQFRVADAASLPVPTKWADVYVSLETIEHLRDDRGYLSEVTRVLAGDGVFICSTPNRTVTNPGRNLDDRPLNRYHVREYSRQEFLELLSGFFESVSLHGQNPISGRRATLGVTLARYLPGSLSARVLQLLKLRHMFATSTDTHRVLPASEGEFFEYLIAVCTGPRFDLGST